MVLVEKYTQLYEIVDYFIRMILPGEGVDPKDIVANYDMVNDEGNRISYVEIHFKHNIDSMMFFSEVFEQYIETLDLGVYEIGTLYDYSTFTGIVEFLIDELP